MRNNIFAAFVMAVLLCGAAFADVSITAENFPDNVFRTYISENFDTDGDGTLSEAEIAEVKFLPADLTYWGIALSGTGSRFVYSVAAQSNALSTVHNFTGIEHLTSLEGLYYDELFKYGQQNLLESVDLSNNTALKYLHFCPAHMEELDLSANTELLCVECPQIGLLSLDVSSCAKMTTFDCRSNDLTALDLSGCEALVSINCSDNALPSLDFSAAYSLGYLYCHNNHLASLDLSDNNLILYADCTSQSITGSYVTATGGNYEFNIATVIPSDEVYRVTEVNAYDSVNSELSVTAGSSEGIYILASVPSRIVYLYDAGYILNNPTLADDNPYHVPMDVTITSIDVHEVFPPEIVSPDGIPLSDFGDLSKDVKSDDNDPEDGHLDENERKKVTSLPHGLGYDYPPVSNIRPAGIHWPIGGGGGGTGIFGRFPNLRRLRITGGWGGPSSWPNNPGGGTTPIDLTGNTELEVLIIENVHLGTIDFTKNTKLRILILINCGLTALNLSSNTALEYLDCSYNYLRTLDLSVNVSLRYIYIHHNYLPHVNLQPNTVIITAQCHSQYLTGVLQDSGNTTNPYQFDLRVLPISEANIGNVVQGTIRAYDASGGTVNVTWNNGVLRFPKEVRRVVYYYRTGRGDILLEVRITLTYSGSGPVTPPSDIKTPPKITTTSITSVFPFTLIASGSTPITWTIVEGSLPSGLSMNSSGVITGTPTQTGTFTFTVRATNSEDYDEKELTITITSLPGSNTGPVITTASPLPDGKTGEEYTKQLEASGSTPFTWVVLTGDLPPDSSSRVRDCSPGLRHRQASLSSRFWCRTLTANIRRSLRSR